MSGIGFGRRMIAPEASQYRFQPGHRLRRWIDGVSDGQEMKWRVENGALMLPGPRRHATKVIRSRIKSGWRLALRHFCAGVGADQLLGWAVWRLVFIRPVPARTPTQEVGWGLRLVGLIGTSSDGGSELRWAILRGGVLFVWIGRVAAASALGVVTGALTQSVFVGLAAAGVALRFMSRWRTDRLDEQHQREAGLLHNLLENIRRDIAAGAGDT